MTSWIQPDTWTPQRWSHGDVLAMQARLDPARMTGYADHWRRVLDDAHAVFSRLDTEVTRRLAESWRGQAARQALEALRHYISEALDGLARCRSLADALVMLSEAASELRAAVDGLDHIKDLEEVRVRYSEPAVAAGSSVTEIPGAPAFPGGSAPTLPVLPGASAGLTVPAGYDGQNTSGLSPPLARSILSGNGFDDTAVSAATHTTGSPAPPFSAPPRVPDAPLPAATLNPATMPTSPLVPPAQAAAGPPPRPGPPYLPLMGGAYPGVIGRHDGAGRRTPGYLITIDNGNKLIGPLPKVAPPVIG
jgi:hypothetical protein